MYELDLTSKIVNPKELTLESFKKLLYDHSWDHTAIMKNEKHQSIYMRTLIDMYHTSKLYYKKFRSNKDYCFDSLYELDEKKKYLNVIHTVWERSTYGFERVHNDKQYRSMGSYAKNIKDSQYTKGDVDKLYEWSTQLILDCRIGHLMPVMVLWMTCFAKFNHRYGVNLLELASSQEFCFKIGELSKSMKYNRNLLISLMNYSLEKIRIITLESLYRQKNEESLEPVVYSI